MQMICILLGVPESERHWLFEAIEPQLRLPAARARRPSRRCPIEEAGSRMYDYGQELIASKRAAADRRHAARSSPMRRCDVERPPVGRRAVPVLQPAVQRGRRDDAQRGRGRAAGVGRTPRPAGRAACGSDAAADRRSRRWCGGRRRRRRSGAPRPRDVGSGGCARSGPATRCWSGRARRTATPRCSTTPIAFDVWREAESALGLRARACTTASARTWPGWSCGCSSRSCSAGSRRCRWSNRWSGPAATATPASGIWWSSWRA